MNYKQLKLQFQILSIRLQKILLRRKLTVPDLPSPTYIFIHHGAGVWDFERVNESHKNKWGFKSSLGFYIGYHYFIEYSGKVYQGRQDNEEGAHTVGPIPHYYNRGSIGICLQGNTNNKAPTKEQLKSLAVLIDKKKRQYSIANDKVLGHKEVAATECPGMNLWHWLIRNYPS